MQNWQQIFDPFHYEWFLALCTVGVLSFIVYRIADILQINFVKKYPQPKDLEQLTEDVYLGKRERKTKRAWSALRQGFLTWSFKVAFIILAIPWIVYYLAIWGVSFNMIYWALIIMTFLLNLLFSHMFSLWTPARLASDYPAVSTLAKGNLLYQAWGVVTWAGPMYVFWGMFRNNGWIGSIITMVIFQMIQLFFFVWTIKKAAIPYQKYDGLSPEFKKNMRDYLMSQGLSDDELAILPNQEEPNAFATGLFGYRQVILTEGLIKGYEDPTNSNFTLKLREDTIEAIVAHEVGHIRKHHVEKSILLGTFISALVTIAVYQLFADSSIYPMFMPETDQQILIYWGQSVFNVMLMYPLTYLMMSVARANERQADQHMLETNGCKNGHDFFHQIRHIAPVVNHPFWHDCNMTHPEPHIREEAILKWDEEHCPKR